MTRLRALAVVIPAVVALLVSGAVAKAETVCVSAETPSILNKIDFSVYECVPLPGF